MSIMGELHAVWHGLCAFVDEIPTGGHVAGYPEDCRRAARHWRQSQTAIDALVLRLQASLAQNIQAGPGGNWNDQVEREFETYWADVIAGLSEQANHCGDMAKTLDDSAIQMDAFNSALDCILVEIAIWIAATIVLAAIPIAGEVEAVAATTRGAMLIARGGMIVRRILTLIRMIAMVFGRAPRAARAVRLLDKAVELERGAAAARAARGGFMIAKFRDWRAMRLLDKAADAWDVGKIQKAEEAMKAYRASWIMKVREATGARLGDVWFNRAYAAAQAGRTARGLRLLDRGVRIIDHSRDISRVSTFGKLWSSYRLTSMAGYVLRVVDKAGLDSHHDPTKGWRSYEALQIFGGALFFAGIGVPVGETVGAFGSATGAWLTRSASGALARSASARFWLGGALARVPGLVESGVTAYTGPAVAGAWTPLNLTAFGKPDNLRGSSLWQDAWGGFTSASTTSSLTALPGNTALALIRPGGIPFGRVAVLPTVWSANVVQELTNPHIRALRGVVSGSPLDTMPGPGVLGAPQPGPFPAATLPSHLVVPGDNLWSIAAGQYGNGLYYPDVAHRNHVPDPNVIQPGQHLTLPPVDPGHPSPPPSPPAAAPAPPAPRGSAYGVRDGDSLWGIAQRAYGDGSRWREIATANGLHGTVLHRGERLWIPPLRRAG